MSLRFLSFVLSTWALLAVGAASADTAKPFLEQGVARWGADYQRFAVLSGKAEECALACQKDGKCRSWTFVRPGIESPSAQCRLKSSVPFAAVDPCCVSGIASGASVGLLAGYENADEAAQTAPQLASIPTPHRRSGQGEGITASIKREPRAEPRPKPVPASGPPMALMPGDWRAPH